MLENGRRTFIAAGDDDVKHMFMVGRLQSAQKTTVSIGRLVHDNVQQLFSCLDGLAVFGLNGLQLLQCESVRLKHVACNALRVYFLRDIRVHTTQHVGVVCNTSRRIKQDTLLKERRFFVVNLYCLVQS